MCTRGGRRTARPDSHRFTGMTKSIMAACLASLCCVKHTDKVSLYRQNVMRMENASLAGDGRLVCFLADSKASERLCNSKDKVDAPVICETRTPPANKSQFKKREGARKVKDFEHHQALADGSLTPASACTYRGLNARWN